MITNGLRFFFDEFAPFVSVPYRVILANLYQYYEYFFFITVPIASRFNSSTEYSSFIFSLRRDKISNAN